MCRICLNELHIVYSFYLKFIDSNNKLQSTISKNEIVNNLTDFTVTVMDINEIKMDSNPTNNATDWRESENPKIRTDGNQTEKEAKLDNRQISIPSESKYLIVINFLLKLIYFFH